MKKRILTLTLALILIISAVATPVSAASGKDVHKYLKEIAMEGFHDTDQGCYYDGFYLDQDEGLVFAVYYWESDQYIETTIFCSDYEVTWRISSNPSPAYNVYVKMYTSDYPKGTVSLAANYNGAAYTSFKSYTGDTSYKAEMLELLNEWLPVVLEFTRAVINENDYSLKDLGLTAYNKCDYVHAYDKGKVTKQPTCVDRGVKTYTCRVCGATRVEYISPTGVHTWDSGTVVKEPTCIAAGTRRYTCTVCKSATRDESIPALGHAWAFDRIVSYGETTHENQARYKCARCGQTKTGRMCADEVFTDMPAEGNWAHDPIDWAYFNGITSGKTATTFAPKDVVTRAEAMTFLWKTVGSPEPLSSNNPFTDVPEGKYFYKPVMWAVENEITKGATDTTFAPKQKCTRAQIMMFIWAAAGKPEPETTENPFKDVSSNKYYYKAILWAVENNITGGIAADKFGPNNTCTRAQIVTFLYKSQNLLN